MEINLEVYDPENECIKEPHKVTWIDIVRIGDKIYGEEFPIENEVDIMDGFVIFRVDNFLKAVAEKHSCSIDDIKTYMQDDIDLPDKYWNDIGYDVGTCGAYIDRQPAEYILYDAEP